MNCKIFFCQYIFIESWKQIQIQRKPPSSDANVEICGIKKHSTTTTGLQSCKHGKWLQTTAKTLMPHTHGHTLVVYLLKVVIKSEWDYCQPLCYTKIKCLFKMMPINTLFPIPSVRSCDLPSLSFPDLRAVARGAEIPLWHKMAGHVTTVLSAQPLPLQSLDRGRSPAEGHETTQRQSKSRYLAP